MVFAFLSSGARAEGAASQKHPSRNVAILLFDGVQIIDYTGPYETFGHVYAFDQPVPFNIYTVAEHAAAITTEEGGPWDGRVSVQRVGGQADAYLVRVSVSKV